MKTPLLEELEIMLSSAVFYDSWKSEGDEEKLTELLQEACQTLETAIEAAKAGDLESLVSRAEEGGAQ